METLAEPDCLREVLDLICYEIKRGTLSSETRGMLADHLAGCAACRREMEDFMVLLNHVSPPDGDVPPVHLFSQGPDLSEK